MRKRRVESYIKREIAQIVNQELNDPRLGMITVTDVEISNDLKSALVYISMLGNQEAKLKLLEKAKGYVKHLLSERITMKFMPDLIFKVDKSYEEGEKIDRLLDEIKKVGSG